MEITGIISAIVIGLVLGAVARLIVPGKQHLPIWLTIVIGIVAALLGTWIAGAIAVGMILTIIIQLIIAALGVYLIDGAWSAGHRSR
ncbi:hypothetical protein FHX37_3644 [Haloactinospora alba]|uniref:Membrane protein YeaQ/YmgE (Transglycosylase-associated protein family) n=1 Tax=Haloactinospora alba TaxID=405555 RepID=A0A543N912_9ACTN|nr:GlsB/YeaQ/YmgE family stress response membrane protein [Haloactinospora alba]TQN28311.1 hypothetical protein FHX37_3644 [Haloactinospora alba]